MESKSLLRLIADARSVKSLAMYRIYDLDESAFDHAEDSEEGAYWIGLLMADGNVCGNAVSICLSGNDGFHLRKLAHFLGTNRPLLLQRRELTDPNHRPSRRLCVHSARLAAALSRYGVVPRKSHTAIPPECLRTNRHFWRGMVDGDGWLFATGKRPVIGFTGSLASVQAFRDYAARLTSIQAVIRPNGNVYKLTIGCRPAVALIRALYSDCSVSLPRKTKIALSILKRFPESSFIPQRSWEFLTKDELLALHAKHGSWEMVAKTIGLDPAFLLRLRRSRGIKRSMRDWSHLSENDLTQLRSGVKNWSAVAVKLGMTDSTLHCIRRRLGLLC